MGLFKSSANYFIDTKPAFLINVDRFAELTAGFPIRNKGRIVIGSGFASIEIYIIKQILLLQQTLPTEQISIH